MECKVSGLVKRGHLLASEVSDTSIEMLRSSIASMISDLATQLDVQLARSNALAAENAGLKELIEQHANSVAVCPNCSHEEPSETDDIVALYRSMETPATSSFLAEVRAQGVGTLSNAAQSVIAERQRQQSAEGWTPEHDDQYGESQLLWASSCYVLNTIHSFNRIPLDWPWEPEWWKPTNPRRDLVKAGALILAEIERIDRAAAGKGE